MSRFRPRPPAGRSASGDDSGFTLVELLVTMFVIGTTLLGLMGVQLQALSTVTLSRQRQQATDLANRTMEQLRALPYDIVTAGSRTTDPSLASDPNVSSGRFRPTYTTGVDEILVTGGTASSVPLYPHVQDGASTKVGTVQFDVATYVTLVSATAGDTSKGYWLTSLVTWSSPQTRGATKMVSTRSQAFSPSGCLATATHPFSGPCQAFFDATAGTTPSGIRISTDSAGGLALQGNDLRTGTVSGPSLSTVVQSEQIVSTQSKSVTSRAAYTTGAGETASGGVSASTGATTDPATGTTTTPAQQSVSQSGGPVGSIGAASTFTLGAGGSDSAGAASASKATAATGCQTASGATVASEQVCSSGQGTLGGPMSATLTMGVTIPLASVTASPTASRAVSARYLTPGGAQCPTASGIGCVAAEVRRSLGKATVGGAPSGVSGLPAGFVAMAAVTGYEGVARAESGNGAAAPQATRAGTLTYWGATGRQDFDLGTGASLAVDLGAVTYSYTSDGVPVTVAMSGDVTAGASGSQASGSAPCQPTACGVESTSGAVVASVTYDITVNGSLAGHFTVDLDLGAATAGSSYRAAPSA